MKHQRMVTPGGTEYLILNDGEAKIRVIPPRMQPSNYNDYANEVTGVPYELDEGQDIPGVDENTTIDFEAIGFNFSAERTIEVPAWRIAIYDYCLEVYGFEPAAYLAYNYPIDN